MNSWETVLAIVGLAVITLVTRSFFLIPEKEVHLPGWLRRSLRYAPLAALAAIVVLPLLGYIALVVFEDIDEAIGRTRALLHRSRETLAQQRNSIRAELLAIGDEIGRNA